MKLFTSGYDVVDKVIGITNFDTAAQGRHLEALLVVIVPHDVFPVLLRYNCNSIFFNTTNTRLCYY